MWRPTEKDTARFRSRSNGTSPAYPSCKLCGDPTEDASPAALVSSPAYFSHAEGKNSLVNGLFRFCSVRFKNWWRHVFKNIFCDVTQVVTLWNSAKETARSRNHPSRSFRTPKSEDLQNLKPLSTSESAKTILSTSEAQEPHPVSWQAQKLTCRAFIEVLAFLRWFVLWFCLA